MSASMELTSAKKNLADVLGDNMKHYLRILKSWFRQKISRDDFDYEARKLLTSDSVHVHNQFLLAILTKCQTIGANIVQKDVVSTSHQQQISMHKVKRVKDRDKKRSQSPRVTFHQRFLQVNPLIHAPLIQPHIPESEERGPGYVSREILLPDVGLIHGRMIVTAWDYGLEDVDDDAIRLLLLAVEMQLKTILTAVLCRQNGYHLREKRFRHNFGTETAPVFLQNTALVEACCIDSETTSVSSKGLSMPSLRPSLETGQRDAAVKLAAGSMEPHTAGHITLFDLYDALQIHKSCLPSHSVYAMAMEKISNCLHHPSNEEFLQDEIHHQEVKLKREISAQQAAFKT
ncbi:hypothetical protein LSH36_269g08061 [Paralvinella palmiformis]|uniref:Transcriptional adapter 1 n=1 Tax=Paralvinella palmiformis TaxID=53620 RepID=A0AAD9JJZ0_9ANNE|nr:hypothetical protein LSH36_269g08061 [Paralvinella palmiformis]